LKKPAFGVALIAQPAGVSVKPHDEALHSCILYDFGSWWYLLPIVCVKIAAFKGETAQPPPTMIRLRLYHLRLPTDWLRRKISAWPRKA